LGVEQGDWDKENCEVDDGVVDTGLEECESPVVATEGVGGMIAGWDKVPEGVSWPETEDVNGMPLDGVL
jgi:hypothetical protein